MPTITVLTLYPVKSCAGIALSEAEVTEMGLKSGGIGDREWMIVDHQGQFLTQREFPIMATIRPSLTEHHLVLNAPTMSALTLPIKRPLATTYRPAMRQVQVWDDTVMAEDCGETANTWCSQLLGISCHLVRFHPDMQRRRESQWLPGGVLTTLFSDGFPMLLVSQASLDDLNEKLTRHGNQAVPMNRFRPNIVIDGVAAFEEEYAASFTRASTQIGTSSGQPEIILKPVKPCPRCPIPAVNQVTGEVEANPVDMLLTYHTHALLDHAPTFGMNTIVAQGQNHLIRVGDILTVQIAF